MIAIFDLMIVVLCATAIYSSFAIGRAIKSIKRHRDLLGSAVAERDQIIVQLVYEIDRVKEGNPWTNDELLQEAKQISTPIVLDSAR